MTNAGIIQTAVSNQLSLELDYRQPSVSVTSSDLSRLGLGHYNCADPEIQDEFEQLLNTIWM